jgi:hydroxypyruvate reductase
VKHPEAIDRLKRAFGIALDAVSPERLVPEALAGIESHGPAVVLGAGKGAAAMAAAFHAHWRAPVTGMVVTRYGHGLKEGEDAGAIRIVEAGHPSPDEASVAAGRELLARAGRQSAGERLFFLASGGGSALAAAALPGIGFQDKRDAANFLMHAGANIKEINCVRKHLSALKGGRLAAAAHPSPVTTYAISDVPATISAISRPVRRFRTRPPRPMPCRFSISTATRDSTSCFPSSPIPATTRRSPAIRHSPTIVSS